MRFVQPKRSSLRSLRFRLMAWNAVVVIVTACVTLLVLREGVRITLIRELDQLLREDLREIEIALSEHEALDMLRPAEIYRASSRRLGEKDKMRYPDEHEVKRVSGKAKDDMGVVRRERATDPDSLCIK